MILNSIIIFVGIGVNGTYNLSQTLSVNLSERKQNYWTTEPDFFALGLHWPTYLSPGGVEAVRCQKCLSRRNPTKETDLSVYHYITRDTHGTSRSVAWWVKLIRNP